MMTQPIQCYKIAIISYPHGSFKTVMKDWCIIFALLKFETMLIVFIQYQKQINKKRY